jgi:hypothetical protein
MEMRQYQGSPDTTELRNGMPSIGRTYNYLNQNQAAQAESQPQPVVAPAPHRLRLPSPHVPHIMGATAVMGARRWVNPNPYTKGSVVMRKQWSRSS